VRFRDHLKSFIATISFLFLSFVAFVVKNSFEAGLCFYGIAAIIRAGTGLR
jgi:hypothetical protein